MEALLRWAAEAGISDSPSQPASSPPTPSASDSCLGLTLVVSDSCLGRTLVVSDFPDSGGRGLAAARDLREGDMVLTVPRDALLTTDSVLRDRRLADCVERHPYLSPTQILTVCLLAEVGKGRGSQWYPYLVQLPQSYDTLATFTEFEIEAFQVEDAKWVSEKAVQQGKSDWKKAIILMQEMGLKPQLLTFRSWLWASATISSRTLHLPWDSAGCLCPVGDLFNYAAPCEEFFSEDLKRVPQSFHSDITSFSKDDTEKLNAEQPDGYSKRLTDGGYQEDTGSYCFYARKRYKKGEQVLLGYGTYTNLELLEHYGFLLNANSNDKAFIPLNAEIYRSSSWTKNYLYIHPNGSPSFSLLCALRLWVTPANLRRAIGHLAYAGSLLSNENELFVMNWVVKHCRSILEKLPTTVEDDEQLLAFMDKMLDGTASSVYRGLPSCEVELIGFLRANGLQKGSTCDLPLPTKAKKSLHRWRLAVQWRLSHKRILLSSVSHCKQMINKLAAQHAPGKSKTRFDMIL